MKDKDRKYNELIGRIKAGKPEPDDSQLLTRKSYLPFMNWKINPNHSDC